MEDSKNRKPIFQDYYTDEDYDDVLLQLPVIIKEAERKTGELLEPTIHEKRQVMEEIKNFIKIKHRKIYGGTALNEAIKLVNPDDAFYDDFSFSDIEFYSITPVPDLVELCNLLYKKGYKYVVANEAQHEETYTVFVNFQIYCDITYVPARVYNGIKTIMIDGINYVDPHFALIDYLRMINQPLTAATQRWEKAFKRMYLLLKNYPFEYFDKPIRIRKPSGEINLYIDKIKKDFMLDKVVQGTCLIMGFEAYNFYIRHAMNDRTVEQMARTTYNINKMGNMITNVPYIEIISVSYRDTVERLYNFLKSVVNDPTQITFDEYFPLFQFTKYSVTINYQGNPIAKIYEGDGFCIPSVKTTKGYMYVSYQYLLMFMFINKFNAHLEKNKEIYFNHSIAISNLVSARNIFLTKKNLGVINNSVFGEFRINCIGSTTSYSREGRLRDIEKNKVGKKRFRYQPESFLNSSPEAQGKFDPSKYKFKNTSGNKIMIPKNLLFRFDDNRNLINEIHSDSENEVNEVNEVNENIESEQQRVPKETQLDPLTSITTSDVATSDLATSDLATSDLATSDIVSMNNSVSEQGIS